VNDAVRERNILLVTSVAHFLAHFGLLIFPSLVLSIQRDWDLPFDRALALGFWMYLLFGLGALPTGVLTDLWRRPRLMIVICLAGMAACSLWAGLTRTASQLTWALGGLGLFASIYHPAGMGLISTGVKRRGWALGVNGVAGNLGEVLAPVAAGLLAVVLGWRSVYLVLAVPSAAMAVLALRLRADGLPAPTVREEAVPRGRRRTVLVFSLLCVAMVCGGIAYRGQTLVLPKWFQEQGGALVAVVEGWTWLPRAGGSVVAATALTSLAYLVGALGQVVGGRLSDRHDLRRVYFGFQACALPLLVLMGRTSGPALLLAAMAYSFFAFGMQPAENSLVAALTPPRLRSTGYGLKFVLVFGMGSLAVKLVGGWERAGGLATVFPRLALFIFGLLASVIVLTLFTRREAIRNRN
jgi:MFS family permease